MVDKGEGDQRYQELKDGIYHGYQPLRARKTITYSYTPDFIPGALNMFVSNGMALNNYSIHSAPLPGTSIPFPRAQKMRPTIKW